MVSSLANIPRMLALVDPFADHAGEVSATDYEQYTYDAAGNRLSLRRRDGRTLTFTYDNLGRMLSKLIPDGCPPIQPPGTGCPAASATRDVFYRYDLLGRQKTAKFDSVGGADPYRLGTIHEAEVTTDWRGGGDSRTEACPHCGRTFFVKFGREPPSASVL